MIRARLTGLLGAALATLAACGGSNAQKLIPIQAAARPYMAAHPVATVPGMTAGIVTEQLRDVAWFCHPGRGSLAGDCGLWAGILLTRDGRTATFACGRVVNGNGTPLTASEWVSCTDTGYVPEPGDYFYVPASLRVTPGHDVRVIRLFAIPV